jgi:hypothetical protein
MTEPQIKDRIVEFKRIKAGELQDHQGNWRLHPQFQRDALRGILGDVGIADVLKAYHSERQGGLTLIDGHLRKEDYPDVEWPVVVLDITDQEADLLLSVYDPLAALAGMDREKTIELTERAVTDDLAVRELLMQIHEQAQKMEEEEAGEADDGGDPEPGPEEMALQPFEHYDYVVLMFKTTFDFERALDLFGIQREGFTIHSTKNYDATPKRKVGLGRVINGALVLNRLCKPES